MRLTHTLVLAGALALAPRPVQACDPAWLPIARARGVAFFVATATGPFAGGHRARLQLAGGPAGRVPFGPILLVPWGYGPDCRPVRLAATQDWSPPRTAAFYTGRLRPRDQWTAGLPTFDVYMSWREPLWQRNDSRWANATLGQKLLTPVEFFELFQHLPLEDELEGDRLAILARLSAWSDSRRALTRKEPARTILAKLRRALGGPDPPPPSIDSLTALKDEVSMPFTPFHLGPGLLIKAAAPSRFSFLGFTASQVVIDLESGYYLLSGTWPVHRVLHTFTLGGLVGTAAGFLAAWITQRIVPSLRDSPSKAYRAEAGLAPGAAGGLTGGLLHSLLDGVMHQDIQPFRPLSESNPLYELVGLGVLHWACVLAGVAGILVLAKAPPAETGA